MNLLRLKIREDEFKDAQKAKYHGIQIDNSVDWKDHSKATSSKVSKAIDFKAC